MSLVQITSESEWMKAQKQAVIMGHCERFDVVQTLTETSVFFSLGSDNVLYATRETQGAATGWTKLDLSSGISSRYGGAKVVAKKFALSQNTFTGKFDVALAVTVSGSDHLFVSQANSYDNDASLNNGIIWTPVEFDGDGQPAGSTKVQIADVFILNSPQSGSTCVVDLWRVPEKNDSLDRYFVVASASPAWKKHLVAIDLDAGSVTSVLGKRTKDQVAGIYTFGAIEGKQELIYAPLYNPFRPDGPSAPSRLKVPDGASSIASSLDARGRSCLFISHPSGVSVFLPSAQNDGSMPSSCIESALVSGATQLSAMTTGSLTSLWGRNAQGGLFYATCPAGSEAVSPAWSTPVIILPKVEHFAFYTGMSTRSHTLFAYVGGQEMVELDQDYVTGCWRERPIMLPATDIDAVVEFNSYTTRVEVIDSDSIPLPGTVLSLGADRPVPVYVDGSYYVLSPNNPVKFTTDGHGALNIVQPTDSLAAVTYTVSPLAPGVQPVTIDPSDKVMEKLQKVKTGDDLSRITMTAADGSSVPLIPGDVSADARDAAAGAIKQFVDIGKGLSNAGPPALLVSTAVAINRSSGRHVFSLSVDADGPRADDQILLHTAEPVHALANGNGGHDIKISTASLGDSVHGWLVKAGDFFRMLGNAIVDGLRTIQVRIVDGVHHIFATIGGVLYRALLDTVSAVVHAVQWVFEKVKVLVDDLIHWLGYVFGWKDIIRTHLVIKNVVKKYVKKTIDSIGEAEDKIIEFFDGLEGKLNTLTGVTDPGLTNGQYAQLRDKTAGSSSPQSHWAMQHAKGHIATAGMTEQNDGSILGSLKQVVHDLEALVANKVEAVKDMIQQIRTQVIEPFAQLTPIQVAQRIIGIVGDLLIKSAKNIIIGVLDLVRHVVQTILNLLDAPLRIPVLSALYKDLTGAELSILDLVVLVVSVPATIAYKIVAGSAPFPNDEATEALIHATDFAQIRDAVNPDSSAHTASVSAVSVMATKRIAVARSIVPSSGAGAVAYKVFKVLSRFIGAFCAMFGQYLSDVKWALDKFKVKAAPALLVCVATNGTLGLFPGIIGAFERSREWQVVMKDVMTGLMAVKLLADCAPGLRDMEAYKKAKPYLTVIVQVAQLPAPIGGFVYSHERPSAFVGLSASICGCVGGILNPIAQQVDDLKTSAIILGGANIASVLNGILLTTAGGLIATDK